MFSSSDEVLELPHDMVTASPGLAIDIGSSAAKIVYRSKKEYRHGKPLDQEGDPRMGCVHLAMFPRENTDDVIAFIDENCDFTRDEEGVAHISATGVGSSTFKSRIEEKLKIKIKVLPEFDCFVKTFRKLSAILSKERLLYPIPEKGKAEGERIARVTEGWVAKTADIMEGTMITSEGAGEEKEEDEEEGLLPCMIAMVGSGAVLMKLNKDGTYNIVDTVYTSGLSFLGLVAGLTGEKDFKKMMEMAAVADGHTATTFSMDLIVPQKSGDEEDMYNVMEENIPSFPMGKVYTAKSKGDVKDADMIQSVYYLFALVHAQTVQLQCVINKLRTAYFCGNMIDNDVARNNITTANIARNIFMPPNKRVDMQFLRNGGMYGALGAFLDSSQPIADNSSATQ